MSEMQTAQREIQQGMSDGRSSQEGCVFSLANNNTQSITPLCSTEISLGFNTICIIAVGNLSIRFDFFIVIGKDFLEDIHMISMREMKEKENPDSPHE